MSKGGSHSRSRTRYAIDSGIQEGSHINNMCMMIMSSTNLQVQCVCMQISAFHFCPLSIPVTAIYDLSYGETEIALGRVFTSPLKLVNARANSVIQYARGHFVRGIFGNVLDPRGVV